MEILIYLLKSGSLLALFFLVYELLLKRETFFALNRYFLLLGIAIAVILPFVNFTKTVVLEQTVTATPVSGSELVSDFAFEPLPVPENESFLANVEWMHVFLIIYGVGVLFLLLRLVFSLISLRRIQKSASHSFRENGFRFIEIENEINPFSFFKTIVYNPKLYNKEELEMILHHETTHAKQWHSLDIMLSQLFLVFQWMNPISWIYARRVDQNLEFIADQKTTAEKVEKKSYQIRLLKSAYQGEFSLPVNNFHSFTKNRIIMMNKRKSHNARSLKALLILPFLAAFLMSFQMKTITEFTTPKKLEQIADTVSDREISVVKRIFSDYHKNKQVNLNGKIIKMSGISKSFYKVTSVDYDVDISKIDAVLKQGYEKIPMNELENGIYLYFVENQVILSVIGREDLFRNKWVFDLGRKHIKGDGQKGEMVLLQFPVNKNTSDRELETIKNKFAEHQIDFKVTRLKRNKSGEIIDIKMTLNNRRGSQTQINEKNSAGIKPYSVGFKENLSIFMNAKS